MCQPTQGPSRSVRGTPLADRRSPSRRPDHLPATREPYPTPSPGGPWDKWSVKESACEVISDALAKSQELPIGALSSAEPALSSCPGIEGHLCVRQARCRRVDRSADCRQGRNRLLSGVPVVRLIRWAEHARMMRTLRIITGSGGILGTSPRWRGRRSTHAAQTHAMSAATSSDRVAPRLIEKTEWCLSNVELGIGNKAAACHFGVHPPDPLWPAKAHRLLQYGAAHGIETVVESRAAW